MKLNFKNDVSLDDIVTAYPHANRALSKIIHGMFIDGESALATDLIILMDPETEESHLGMVYENNFGFNPTTYYDEQVISDMLETVKRYFPDGKDPDNEIDIISKDVVRLVKANRPYNYILEIYQVLNDRYGEAVCNDIMTALKDLFPDVEYYLNGIDTPDSIDDGEEIDEEAE